MKKLLSLVLALCMLSVLTGAVAEAVPVEAAPDAPVEAVAEVAEEPLSVTHHTAQVAGQALSYTATAGRLPVELQGNQCQMFFIAYTLDGVEDVSARPVTFAFNGGPGSGSLWLWMRTASRTACRWGSSTTPAPYWT